MSDSTTVRMKRCNHCKEEKPATTEYFCRRKSNPDGLNGECKHCVWVRAQRDKEKRKAYYQEWHARNRDRLNKQHREYHHKNRDVIIAKKRIYNEQHREDLTLKQRVYIQLHREEIARKGQIYARKNPQVSKAAYQRRRARKLALPDTFIAQDWLNCLEYFHNTCAVCGNQLRDLFGQVKPHADHWHPLNQPGCPGTVPENMICLCSSCNCSKHDRMPEKWLIDYFGKSKAKTIISRVSVYFASVKRDS